MREAVYSVFAEIATLLRTGLPNQTLHASRILWSRWTTTLVLMLGGSMVIGTVTERLGLGREMNFAGSQFLSWKSWLGAVILAPVIEELVFRGGLRSARIVLLAAWAVLLALAFVSPWRNAALGLLALLTVAALAYLMNRERRKALLGRIRRTLLRRRVLWVHLSTLVFAASHLSNWKAVTTVPLSVPLLVLPQLVAGYGLAYICIRMGLKWSMLAHAAMNFSLLLLVAVFG